MTNKPRRRSDGKPQAVAIQKPRTEATRSTPDSRVAAMHQRMSVAFETSPLPSGELLEQYNTLIPNGAERFMALVERQAEHRQHMERYVIESDHQRASRGQIWGGVIAILGFVLVGYLATIGQPLTAGVIGIGELGSLVGIFVLDRRRRSKDIEQKART